MRHTFASRARSAAPYPRMTLRNPTKSRNVSAHEHECVASRRVARGVAPREATDGEHVTQAEICEMLHSFLETLRLFLRQHQGDKFEFDKVTQIPKKTVWTSFEKRRRLEAMTKSVVVNVLHASCRSLG